MIDCRQAVAGVGGTVGGVDGEGIGGRCAKGRGIMGSDNERP